MKNERGITLLSLALTVIVMIMLAGVTLYLSINNDNGVINEVKEETKLQQNMVQVEKDKMNTVLQDLEKDWGLN